MSSFLRRLKGEGIGSEEKPQGALATQDKGLKGVTQLDVDVYQSEKEIVIYAPTYGCDIEGIDVSIEGDNDVITIQGERKRPEELVLKGKPADGKFFSQECAWGQFYRQIILPEEIDVGRAEAKMSNGVLILSLPLMKAADKKIKMKVLRLDGRHKE